MIIGNCTYSVRDYLRSGEMDLLEFAAYNAEIGITALEYNDMFFEDFSDETLAAVRRSAEEAGCSIVCLTCGGNLASDDADANAAQVELFKQHLQHAHALGANAVRFNIGTTGDEQRDLTVGVERVIDGFNQLLPLARELDVKITIENHGGVSKWANPILQIVLGTDPEWVGSCPDFGNFKPIEFRYIELAKVIPFAHHTHAKTHEFDENGEDAEYSMERVLALYHAAGVDGVLSIEFEGSIDQKEGVIKTRDLLQRYM
ncbi:MAG: sugar phosphate isomerase/epimerase family protein [Armatimonadota bacterium]|jgi:sugar phosphate isomerase/epimerase